MEQTTVPEKTNRDITPQEIVDDVSITKETQKDRNKTPENIQKTPENTQKTRENSQNTLLQEEPINNRGAKYNLRPNPNANFSDSYR